MTILEELARRESRLEAITKAKAQIEHRAAERPVEAGREVSVGSIRDSCGNAFDAEAVMVAGHQSAHSVFPDEH